MGRRNKGGTHGQRSGADMASRARAAVEEATRARLSAIMGAIGDMEVADGHALMMHVIVAMEEQMDALGIEPTVTQRVSGNVFVPCRRCRFSEVAREDAMGKIARCSVLEHAGGAPLESCRTDGCTWGIEKERR